MTLEPLQKLFGAIRQKSRLTNAIVIAGICGMALIALSEWLPQPKSSSAPDAVAVSDSAADSAYGKQLEQRLQALIVQLEGAGQTEVMVTLAEGSQTVYATDTETDADGSRREQHLLLEEGSDPPALAETTRPPAVQGVAVLCEGGGNAVVQARVTEIVTVLTGVGASHITVEQLKPAE